jgi:hypothetical protein
MQAKIFLLFSVCRELAFSPGKRLNSHALRLAGFSAGLLNSGREHGYFA